MSNFLANLKTETTRCVMAPDGRVYKLRRINSLDMAGHKRAELLGQQAAAEELQRLQKEAKEKAEQWKLDSIDDPEEKAKRKKNMEAWAETAQAKAIQQILSHMTRDEKTTAMYLGRVDAYCCAGIVGGHWWDGEGPDPLIDWIEEHKKPNYPDEEPVAYIGRVPEARCHIVSVRFAEKEDGEDLGEGIGWIGDIDEQTRQWLCGQVSDLSGSAIVKPFRRPPGRAPTAGRDGETLQDGPVPDPDVGS